MIFNPTGVPVIKLLFGKSALQLLHLAPHGGQPFGVDFMDDPSGIRPPGKNGKGRRIGDEKQIVVGGLQPRDGCCVKRKPLLKSALQFRWHNGDIFLNAKNIAEGKTDKLYVVFFDKFHNFRFGVKHDDSPIFRPVGRRFIQ